MMDPTRRRVDDASPGDDGGKRRGNVSRPESGVARRKRGPGKRRVVHGGVRLPGLALAAARCRQFLRDGGVYR